MSDDLHLDPRVESGLSIDTSSRPSGSSSSHHQRRGSVIVLTDEVPVERFPFDIDSVLQDKDVAIDFLTFVQDMRDVPAFVVFCDCLTALDHLKAHRKQPCAEAVQQSVADLFAHLSVPGLHLSDRLSAKINKAQEKMERIKKQTLTQENKHFGFVKGVIKQLLSWTVSILRVDILPKMFKEYLFSRLQTIYADSGKTEDEDSLAANDANILRETECTLAGDEILSTEDNTTLILKFCRFMSNGVHRNCLDLFLWEEKLKSLPYAERTKMVENVYNSYVCRGAEFETPLPPYLKRNLKRSVLSATEDEAKQYTNTHLLRKVGTYLLAILQIYSTQKFLKVHQKPFHIPVVVSILDNPQYKRDFLEFSKTIRANENVEFYLELSEIIAHITQFQSSSSSSSFSSSSLKRSSESESIKTEVVMYLRPVYDTYLSSRAPRPVCCTETLRAQVRSYAYGRSLIPPVEALQELLQITLSILCVGVFPHFRSHFPYAADFSLMEKNPFLRRYSSMEDIEDDCASPMSAPARDSSTSLNLLANDDAERDSEVGSYEETNGVPRFFTVSEPVEEPIDAPSTDPPRLGGLSPSQSTPNVRQLHTSAAAAAAGTANGSISSASSSSSSSVGSSKSKADANRRRFSFPPIRDAQGSSSPSPGASVVGGTLLSTSPERPMMSPDQVSQRAEQLKRVRPLLDNTAMNDSELEKKEKEIETLKVNFPDLIHLRRRSISTQPSGDSDSEDEGDQLAKALEGKMQKKGGEDGPPEKAATAARKNEKDDRSSGDEPKQASTDPSGHRQSIVSSNRGSMSGSSEANSEISLSPPLDVQKRQLKKCVSFREFAAVSEFHLHKSPSTISRYKEDGKEQSNPSKGILKKKSTARIETFEEALIRVVKERELEAARLLRILSRGAVLKKYNAMQTSNKRWFQVSEDGTEIVWETVLRKKFGLLRSRKARLLASVEYMRYGTYYSRRFTKYNYKEKPPWLGFTIFFEDRTLDIVCKDEEEVTTWFLGIQSLIPLSQNYLSKGALLWERARMKILVQADEMNITPLSFCKQLIREAQEAERARQVAEKGGTDDGSKNTGDNRSPRSSIPSV